MASVATCAVDEKLDLPHPQHPEFRSRMRALRRKASLREASKAASAVKNILLAEPVIQNAGSIAVYAATDGEVDVSDAARWAQEAGKRVFFPAMRAMRKDNAAATHADAHSEAVSLAPSAHDRLRIAFVEWLPEAPWGKGTFGIPEPAGGEEIAIEKCDAALVPGVAFGRDGSRVGRGKGYYDQVLAFLAEGSRPRPPVLFGICHDFQIIEGLEHSPLAARDNDIPMDAVVSPAGIHWRNRG